MPNWATNHLIIEGDDDRVQHFINAVTVNFMSPDQPVDTDNPDYNILQSLLPCPQELRDTPAMCVSAEPNPAWAKSLANGELTQAQYDKMVSDNEQVYAQQQANLAKYGVQDWYDWSCLNWGTKWSDHETYIASRDTGMAPFRFDTSWAPPISGIAKIAETLYPDLLFIIRYHEEGMCYAGCTGFKGDNVVTPVVALEACATCIGFKGDNVVTHEVENLGVEAPDDYDETEWDEYYDGMTPQWIIASNW